MSDEPTGNPLSSREPSDETGRRLEAFLLFEVLRSPSYGYSLIQRLQEYGFGQRSTNPTVVYRVLRSLETAGAIQSAWVNQVSGPSRRYYTITAAGRELLDRRLARLRRQIERTQRLLAEYDADSGSAARTDGLAALDSTPGGSAPLITAPGERPAR